MQSTLNSEQTNDQERIKNSYSQLNDKDLAEEAEMDWMDVFEKKTKQNSISHRAPRRHSALSPKKHKSKPKGAAHF